MNDNTKPSIAAEPKTLTAKAGDVLFSYEKIPYPGNILSGFSGQNPFNKSGPRVNFDQLQNLLEFLEHVVLIDRLIIPIPQYSKKTEQIINNKKREYEFAVFRKTGDLDFTTEQIFDRLENAGIAFSAAIDAGNATADDVITRLLPTSKILQKKFWEFMHLSEGDKKYDKFDVAQAHMAYWLGSPLHMAEAATYTNTPYVLGQIEERSLEGYENETFHVRKSISEVLLQSLNSGTRKEISQLTQLGQTIFPETPIAYQIIQNANSPHDMLEVALQLREEFNSFRRHINEIEQDMTNENNSLKTRIKRMKEIEALAASLWPNSKTSFRTAAKEISESLLSLPELAEHPLPTSTAKLIAAVASLPFERLIQVYQKRKIRILLKAKNNFLNSPDLTKKLASILNIDINIVKRSNSKQQ